MADKEKSLGQTVLGWFVVQEGAEEGQEGQVAKGTPAPPVPGAGPWTSIDPNVDDLIARYAGGGAPKPAAPQRPAVAQASAAQQAQKAGVPVPAPAETTDKTQVTAPGRDVPPAQLDFAEVFKKQGLSAEQLSHVDRTLTLLNNLPKETPKEVKRQIVEASLLAFGIPVDRIIESAALHLRALDRHADKGQQQTQALLDESNQRLKALEQEAARIRKIMQEQQDSQQGLVGAVSQQKGRIQEVLDFFGKEAVDRVVSSSSRLREP